MTIGCDYYKATETAGQSKKEISAVLCLFKMLILFNFFCLKLHQLRKNSALIKKYT